MRLPGSHAEHPARLLGKLGIFPSKRLGQNFLHDRNVCRRIFALAEAQGPPFLEIGPGLGALTGLFAGAGHRVVAVEVDRRLCAFLRERLAGPNVEVLEGDFLRLGERAFRDLFPAGGTAVGNLPYAISSPALFRLVDLRDIFPRAVLMLQREVAGRLCAPPGGKNYGVLSVQIAAVGRAQIQFAVSRNCFTPPPAVDSAVVSIAFRPGVPDGLLAVLRSVVRAAFSRRRKALRNAPVPAAVGGGARWAALLSEAGIDPGARAETVPPERYLALAEAAAPLFSAHAE